MTPKRGKLMVWMLMKSKEPSGEVKLEGGKMYNVEAYVKDRRETNITWRPGGLQKEYLAVVLDGTVVKFPESIAARDVTRDSQGFVEFAEQIKSALDT